MRIHGEYNICRSVDIKEESNYKNYIPRLREDFKRICGYCGKHEEVTTRGFEPDHFVPFRIDQSRNLDYSNLVYACFTCNRKKSGKWPTEDKNKPNDGKVGFVDPATDEYDEHVGRKNNGCIEFYTDIGQYMCEDVFKFNIRPIEEIWRITELINAKKKLAKIMDKLTKDELEKYIKLDIAIVRLKEIIFDKRE